jgi:uncharacterized membrane protein
MNLFEVLLLAFLVGVVAGLRSMTAPAVLAWAAHRGWLDLHDSPLAFMGSTAAVVIFTLLALAELVVDKLPSTPSRTTVGGFLPRLALGMLSGAVVASAGHRFGALGVLLGAVGAIVGTFGGHGVRARLVRTLKVPDFVIAVAEDLVAIGASLLIVSRF